MKTKTIIISLTILAIILIMTKKAFAAPTASKKIRGCDPFGCGSFGAGRGERKHQGEDFTVSPGESIFSPISGTVTRFPFPYGNDLSYTGIEIKNSEHEIKIFYMTPTVKIGQAIAAGQVIGKAQDIAKKYGASMTNHIHVELRDKKGTLLQISNFI
ncbi:M23 family metallopeptidase [Flavobacterium sp. WW92]|uniref:M23 family metallopeptidase n=1 Tax=unclassified Flavobacterium TaxID=196869 RepID=UPI002223F086|nr:MULTISPECIES: M23 family metallopeptidase [unclassified Flavobacterium]WDO13050.1 M23 family metallopeptidase [Flavobacterium sp. WW92]